MYSVIITKIYEEILSDEYKWDYKLSIKYKFDFVIKDDEILITEGDNFYLDKFYNTIHLSSILEILKEKYPIDVIALKNNNLYRVIINKSKYRKFIIDKLK